MQHCYLQWLVFHSEETAVEFLVQTNVLYWKWTYLISGLVPMQQAGGVHGVYGGMEVGVGGWTCGSVCMCVLVWQWVCTSVRTGMSVYRREHVCIWIWNISPLTICLAKMWRLGRAGCVPVHCQPQPADAWCSSAQESWTVRHHTLSAEGTPWGWGLEVESWKLLPPPDCKENKR